MIYHRRMILMSKLGVEYEIIAEFVSRYGETPTITFREFLSIITEIAKEVNNE